MPTLDKSVILRKFNMHHQKTVRYKQNNHKHIDEVQNKIKNESIVYFFLVFK